MVEFIAECWIHTHTEQSNVLKQFVRLEMFKKMKMMMKLPDQFCGDFSLSGATSERHRVNCVNLAKLAFGDSNSRISIVLYIARKNFRATGRPRGMDNTFNFVALFLLV